MAWAKRVAAAIGSHPCFVDLLRVRATRRIKTRRDPRPLASVLFAACRQQRINFVPVLPVGCDSRHLEAVRDAIIMDGRGVCLRHRPLESVFATGLTLSGALEQTLASLGVPVTEADLVFDLGFLGPTASVDAGRLRAELHIAARLGHWRSLVLLGSSIPETMGCVREGTVGSLPRLEWQLWQELRCVTSERIPSFGDYAIQHPKPSLVGGGQSMRANIRYTVSRETIIPRGVGPVSQEGNEQYRELCSRLAALRDFAGGDYSWGDSIIVDCAAGAIAPGAQDMWRGVGTSHHLRSVTEDLAAIGL